MTSRSALVLTAALLLGAAFAWLHSVQRVIEDGSQPVLHDARRGFDPSTTSTHHTRPPESPAAAEIRSTSERAARSTILFSK